MVWGHSLRHGETYLPVASCLRKYNSLSQKSSASKSSSARGEGIRPPPPQPVLNCWQVWSSAGLTLSLQVYGFRRAAARPCLEDSISYRSPEALPGAFTSSIPHSWTSSVSSISSLNSLFAPLDFPTVLASRRGTSCLHSKHPTDWVISWALSFAILTSRSHVKCVV